MSSHPGIETGGSAQQYLTFVLGDEHYGVDILRVQEIKGYSATTPIPNAPAHVKGVMNLRGTVVPVFDLRARFGMPPREYDRFTVIVVVTVGVRVVGVIVDGVSDVVSLEPQSVDAAPELGSDVDTSMIQGIARENDRLITLLEIDQVIATEPRFGDNGPAAAATGPSTIR